MSIDGSAVEGSEEESEPSSDEDVDHESEDDDEADSGAIRLRRLFGPLYVVGYRLKLPREMRERAAPVADPNGGAAARGMSRTKSMAHMGRREMADLGCRVFLRHPTDPDSLTALFGRLADARGLRQEAEESKAKVCRAVATAAQATARQRAAALLSRRAALEAQAAATLRGVPSGGRDTHRDDDVASVMDVGFGNARVRREDSGLINLSAALFYDNQGEFESEGEEEVQPAGGARSRARRGSMTGGRGRRGSFAGSAPPLPGSGMGLGGTTTPRGQGVVDPAQVDLERGRSAGLDDAPVDVNRDIYPRRDPGSDREGRTASSSKRRNRSHRSKRRSAVDDNDDDSEAGGYASTGRRSHKSGRSGRSGSRRGGGD